MYIVVVQNPDVTTDMFGHWADDTYDGFVVAAHSPEDALAYLDEKYPNWLPKSQKPSVTVIGKAYEFLQRGLIMYSWSSSG
jgi:hypothetical protein